MNKKKINKDRLKDYEMALNAQSAVVVFAFGINDDGKVTICAGGISPLAIKNHLINIVKILGG
jgi:hypothetical protein